MAGDVYFGHGDLLEYTRTVSPSRREMTLRAVVMGFTIIDRRSDQRHESDFSMTVWLYEGNVQLGKPEDKDLNDISIVETAIKTDKEPELVGLDIHDLIEMDPVVIRQGNSPREVTNFEVS